MKICHCTLPYTNPDACKTCGNNYDNGYHEPKDLTAPLNNNYWNVPNFEPIKSIKRITKTITKLDKKGKVKSSKMIVTEEEIINTNNTFTVTSSTSGTDFVNNI